jgi:cardiolipin synthase
MRFGYNESGIRFAGVIGMDIPSILISLVMISNLIFAIIMIFKERRDVGATWAWLLVLFFVPVLGFILYILLGMQSLKREQLFQWEDLDKVGIGEVYNNQLAQLESGQFQFRNEAEKKHQDLIYMLLKNNYAILTENNAVEIITDGREKFDKLFADIANARSYIHIQYYIIQNDSLGNRLIQALTEKAKEGVTVRVLYDDLGSRRLTRSFFKKFREAGGQAEAFFPSKLRFINLRMNYRNHRKLIVIDGEIAYIGGFNVGDEYVGLHKKFGYWRDTHLRIEGPAVYLIQTRFILDWNQASAEHKIAYDPDLFPPFAAKGEIGVQIVTSGPVSQYPHIKNGFLKMIASAQKSIYIQTPYFIPDTSLMDALTIALLTGVEVNIMIPDKSDHPFIRWASLAHIGELLKCGANVYLYNKGFIHAKSIVIDEEIASVGTANMDVRSFKLNFEANAFLYDERLAKQLNDTFREDMKVSTLLTYEEYLQRPLNVRFKESISRLLSPIL